MSFGCSGSFLGTGGFLRVVGFLVLLCRQGIFGNCPLKFTCLVFSDPFGLIDGLSCLRFFADYNDRLCISCFPFFSPIQDMPCMSSPSDNGEQNLNPSMIGLIPPPSLSPLISPSHLSPPCPPSISDNFPTTHFTPQPLIFLHRSTQLTHDDPSPPPP